MGQAGRGELIFSGACTLEHGEPQPWRFPLRIAMLTEEHKFWEGSVCRQGFGIAWWIMMEQLIMTRSVNAAEQEKVQDTEDGRIHINREAYELLIYSGSLTLVRSSSQE